jgi:TPR repeat protein
MMQEQSSLRIYDDLKKQLQTNDRDKAIDLYYQLLSSGRPLSEIIAAGVQDDSVPAPGESDQTVAVAPAGPSISRQPVGSPAVAQTPEPGPTGSAQPRNIVELLAGRAVFGTENGNASAAAASGVGPVLSAHQGSVDALRDLNTTAKAGSRDLPQSGPKHGGAVSKVRPIALGLAGICAIGLAALGIPFVEEHPEIGSSLSRLLRNEQSEAVPASDPGPSASAKELQPKSAEEHSTEAGSSSPENTNQPKSQMAPSAAPEAGPLPASGLFMTATVSEAAPGVQTVDGTATVVPETPPALPPATESISTAATTPAATATIAPALPNSSSIPELSTPPEGRQPAIAVSPPAPPKHERSTLSKGEIEAMLSRGDIFLAAGDLTSARLFYQYAADAGDGGAALRLGQTFDPVFLQQANLTRLRGDPKQAAYWYRRALELGNTEAKVLLDTRN